MDMSSVQPLQEKRYSRLVRKTRRKKSSSKDNPKLAKPAKSTLKRKLFTVSHRNKSSSNNLESSSCINVIKSVASQALVLKRKPPKPAKAGIFMFGKQSEYKKRDVPPLNKLSKARLDGDLQRIIRLSNGLNESLIHDITRPIVHKNTGVSGRNCRYNNSSDVDSPPLVPSQSNKSFTHFRTNSNSPASSGSVIRFSPPASSTQNIFNDHINTYDPVCTQHLNHSGVDKNLVLSSSSEISFEENDDQGYQEFATMISDSVVEITEKFPHVFGPPRSCLKEAQEKLRQLFCERAEDDEVNMPSIPAHENQNKIKKDATEQVPTVRKEHMKAYVLLTPLHKMNNSSTQTTVNVLKNSRVTINKSEKNKEDYRVSVEKVSVSTFTDTNSVNILSPLLPDPINILNSLPLDCNSDSSSLPSPVFLSKNVSIDTILDPVKFVKMNCEHGNRVKDRLLLSNKKIQKNKIMEQRHRIYHKQQFHSNPSLHSIVEYESQCTVQQNTRHVHNKHIHDMTSTDNTRETKSAPLRNSVVHYDFRDTLSAINASAKPNDVCDMKLFSYDNILARQKRIALRNQTNNARSGYVSTYNSIFSQSNSLESQVQITFLNLRSASSLSDVMSDLSCELEDFDPVSRHEKQSDVVHILQMKLYRALEGQLECTDTAEDISDYSSDISNMQDSRSQHLPVLSLRLGTKHVHNTGLLSFKQGSYDAVKEMPVHPRHV